MDFPVGEFDQIGNLAAHIEGRVEFDRTLRRAELRPGKKTETEVDRRGVDGTEFVLERELPLRGKYLALLKHRIEEGFVDRRRTMLVGVGDRGTGNGGKPEVVPHAVQGTQSGLNSPQGILPGGLGVDQGAELVLAGERLHVPIGFVLSNKRFKAVLREQMQHLLQDCGSVGHTKKGGSVRLLTRLRCRPFSLWARAGFQIRSKFLWTVVMFFIDKEGKNKFIYALWVCSMPCLWIVLQSNGKRCVSSARTSAAKQCQ